MTDRRRKYFWGVIIALHLGYFVYQAIHLNAYTKDSYQYEWQAKNIIDHGEFYSGDLNNDYRTDFRTIRPAGYPLFIVMTSWAGGITATLFLQNLFSLFNLWLLLKLFRRFKINEKLDRLIPMFLILNPSHLIYTNMLMTELLLQTSLLCLIVLLFRYKDHSKTRDLTLLSIVCVVSISVKPVAMFLWIPILVLVLVSVRKSKKWVQIIIPLMIPAFVFTYNSWNKSRTGFSHYSSIKYLGMEFNHRHFQTSLYGETIADSLQTIRESEIYAKDSYAEQKQLQESLFIKSIKDNFVDYLIFHFKHVPIYLLDPGRFDLHSFFGINEQERVASKNFAEKGFGGAAGSILNQPGAWPIILIIVLFVNGIKSLSLLYLMFNKSVPAFERWTMLFLIAYLAVLTGPMSASRYAVPVYPIFIISVALLTQAIKERGWKALLFRN